MATNKTNLSVNSLDFDTIRSNLKSYLQGQDTFKDYNFEGSAISTLLDVLAYNTHYEAFYNNMVANEMFLDSAAKRDSVVSIAKHLGYTPTSPRCSEATVNVVFGSTAGMDDSTIIPIGSKFTAEKDGVGYSFINLSTGTVSPSSEIHCSNLKIKEGKLNKFTYINDSSDSDQKFIIPHNNADTSTLTVRVQNSVTDSTGYTDSWNLSTTINDVTSTSKVYFLQEEEDGKFEVYFGDDVVGKSLKDGNLVILEYMTTNGSIANDIGSTDSAGSRSFSYGTNNDVSVVSKSSGGAERESISSIRRHAPSYFQAQNRAVTSEDFKSILVQDYPDVDSVHVWGGEENEPPEYGTVFISFKPSTGTIITEETKNSISDSLAKNRSIVAITPKITDPNYIHLVIDSTINYDEKSVSVSQESLKTLVNNKITTFGETFLEKFDRGLRYSKFLKDIDGADPSILSNETSVTMEYRLYPDLGITSYYSIEFGNPISNPHSGHVGAVYSSSFNYFDENNILRESYLDDDGKGKIRIYYFADGIKTYLNNDAGEVDYESGIVTVNNTKIMSIPAKNYLSIYAIPRDKDIESKRNTVLLIDKTDPEAINLSMNAVKVF